MTFYMNARTQENVTSLAGGQQSVHYIRLVSSVACLVRTSRNIFRVNATSLAIIASVNWKFSGVSRHCFYISNILASVKFYGINWGYLRIFKAKIYTLNDLDNVPIVIVKVLHGDVCYQKHFSSDIQPL